jgi:hypothetical protein
MREPTCTHDPSVRVSSHEDLVAASKTNEPMASMYSCDRPACREEITFWVQGQTGKPAVVVPLKRRAA